jgi:hypothetical protein
MQLEAGHRCLHLPLHIGRPVEAKRCSEEVAGWPCEVAGKQEARRCFELVQQADLRPRTDWAE